MASNNNFGKESIRRRALKEYIKSFPFMMQQICSREWEELSFYRFFKSKQNLI